MLWQDYRKLNGFDGKHTLVNICCRTDEYQCVRDVWKMSLCTPCRVHDYTRFHNTTFLPSTNHGWMISTGGGISFRSRHLHCNLPTHTIESLSVGIICAVIMLLVLSNRLFNHMLQWAWDTLKTSGPRQVPEIISCNSFENDCVYVAKYLSSWKVRRESELEVQSKKLYPLEMVKERVLQSGRLKERQALSRESKAPLYILLLASLLAPLLLCIYIPDQG